MALMTVRQLKHQACLDKLRNIGCTVINIEGVMFLIKYKLKNNMKLTYFYHLNDDNTYFLERIKPYVVEAGTFDTEEEIVNSIIVDINQFINASNSKNFGDFIDLTTKLSNNVKSFDDLFLHYNISKEDVASFNKLISEFSSMMSCIKEHSEEIKI
ncbi:hypothetical protein PV797_06490 [Clostridiaceae bacterium M8S5]|nr:hypothetical protein PV797_06490 [Clostridiaceae bacterium M8S5]